MSDDASRSNSAAGHNIRIRELTVDDMPAFLALIEALADYEHLAPPDDAARNRLKRDALANPPLFRALLAEANAGIAGYAVYFFTYSTFLARPTLYLEDIFVLPEKRGFGVGRALMRALAQEAQRGGCGRMEWQVLDWNTSSQAFYQKIGAQLLKEWQSFRVTEETIRALAEHDEIDS